VVLLTLSDECFFTDAQSVRIETIVTGGDGAMIVGSKNRSGKDVHLNCAPSDSLSITHVPNERDGSITITTLLDNVAACQSKLSCVPANLCTFLQYNY
jgi:hypothetical protein